MTPKFSVGNEVAWSHEHGALHAAGSILRKDALPAGTPIGVVTAIANEEGTWFEVTFPDTSVRTLTNEELVRVA
jgi:hypothetical protein